MTREEKVKLVEKMLADAIKMSGVDIDTVAQEIVDVLCEEVLPSPFEADCQTCAIERSEALKATGKDDDYWRSLGFRMYLCPECGDKRCPRAHNHAHPCFYHGPKTPNPEADGAPLLHVAREHPALTEESPGMFTFDPNADR